MEVCRYGSKKRAIFLSTIALIRAKFLLLGLIISGCSITPTSTKQYTDELEIELSGSEKDVFSLITTTGRVLATSYGDDSTLSFPLPNYSNPNQCVTVRNSKGENLFGGEFFSLPLIGEFNRVNSLRDELGERVQHYSNEIETYENLRVSQMSALDRHRAFNGNSCFLPEQRALPRAPITKCDSYSECAEEGGAICYSRFIGTEGCSIALRELNVSGMLSSPGCAAAAASLAGEKYDMDDAFVDFLHGVADDVGNSLLESESFWDNVLGAIVVAGNYGVKLENARQCTNSFIARHYGPLQSWRSQVNRIRSEPQISMNECVNLVQSHNEYNEKRESSTDKRNEASLAFSHVDVVYRYLADQTRTVDFCNEDSVTSDSLIYLKNGYIKRYLIGATVQNYQPNADEKVLGVTVSSVEPGGRADIAGITAGDVLLSGDGQRFSDIEHFIDFVTAKGTVPMNFNLLRDNQALSISVTPAEVFLPVQLN